MSKVQKAIQESGVVDMALKWKRPEAGHYNSTNGRWRILKEGSKWRLYDNQKTGDQEVFSASNKADCKQKAEKKDGKKAPPVRKPPPKRPENPIGKKVDADAQVHVVNKSMETDESVGSALLSLYLEISGLRFSLERTLHSVGAVENALQKIVDPDKDILKRQRP